MQYVGATVMSFASSMDLEEEHGESVKKYCTHDSHRFLIGVKFDPDISRC